MVERLSPRIRASHDSVTQRFSWVVSGLLVSRKCLKSLGRRAITNRLLYQLSYVGFQQLADFLVTVRYRKPSNPVTFPSLRSRLRGFLLKFCPCGSEYVHCNLRRRR